ncbi:VirD4-like conjugal transfer protein, CD1115 family [Enterococcus plantarum]|uniref:VirD4-like conjugal transfer protein, CD1115 family n=1 Tax=Enterococcus plantarum TaxID=1077675 RepID=UPI001A8F9E93|nr:type IV secretory system conjugative DNA transfer family protein [Enterococcus plantarum]MBO0423386.1 type IV secretory system conjugative DNA transfer family protein [Enterococcus plantarum]
MVITKVKELFTKVDQLYAKRILLAGLLILALFFGNVFSSVLNNFFYVLPRGLERQSLLGFHMIRYFWVYLVMFTIAGIAYYVLWLKVQINYESVEEGKKATSRFTSVDELIAQYKQVPIHAKDSTETYEGLSGTIVARHKDKLFIDTDPAHNFTLGRSRSAKGQTKVLPDMDVYSRSEEKPHLVIGSGKYELAVAAIPEYKRRGYETSVMNLIHLDRSFMYNCLDLIKQAYLEKDIDNAIELCKTFSYPLYHNDEAREPVWEETAMALVNAVILALCYEFLEKSEKPEETEKYVSMYAVSNMLVELGTPNEKGDTLLDKYFSSLPAGNPAKMEYSTVQYADGQMRSSIFATTQAKLRNFIAPKVAKMMSRSTFDFKRLTKDSTPFDMTSEIVIRGAVNTAIEGEYELTYEITNEFKDVITCQRTVIVSNADGYSSFPNKDDYFTGVDHLTIPVNGAFDSREGVSCWYYYKPQAVFLVLPDYIQTNYIIASTWISQLYHVASDFASNCPGDKLLKRIRVILDEFGNLPGFSNMASMLSVGAGRGILFDFYVQHPNQLQEKYGEKVGKMIEDEAMNYFFLMTRSKQAREDFSALLGDKEITVQSRSGGVFDLNKQFTETVETRPLLEPYELGRLQEGEVVVDRSIHRQDLNGNPATPYPIFNTGDDGKLMYAHKYLKEFDPSGSWKDLDLPTVPDIPLEQYSRNFVQRIKNPLAQREEDKQILEQRKELEEIMSEPEAILDNEYKGLGGPKIAANLEKIDQLYLPGERKEIVEVVGADHLFTIHEMLVKDKPQNEDLIDSFDYYDQYVSYLQKEENKAVLESLKFLGYFTEE